MTRAHCHSSVPPRSGRTLITVRGRTRHNLEAWRAGGSMARCAVLKQNMLTSNMRGDDGDTRLYNPVSARITRAEGTASRAVKPIQYFLRKVFLVTSQCVTHTETLLRALYR
eukprot:5661779-Prymnesium_polylepis.1